MASYVKKWKYKTRYIISAYVEKYQNVYVVEIKYNDGVQNAVGRFPFEINNKEDQVKVRNMALRYAKIINSAKKVIK